MTFQTRQVDQNQRMNQRLEGWANGHSGWSQKNLYSNMFSHAFSNLESWRYNWNCRGRDRGDNESSSKLLLQQASPYHVQHKFSLNFSCIEVYLTWFTNSLHSSPSQQSNPPSAQVLQQWGLLDSSFPKLPLSMSNSSACSLTLLWNMTLSIHFLSFPM